MRRRADARPPGAGHRSGHLAGPAGRGGGPWLALALAALVACAPEPASSPPAAAAPAAVTAAEPGAVAVVTGEVRLRLPGGRPLALAGADVLFVTEAAMQPFLADRLEEAAAGLRRLRAERERVGAERRAALAEADRTSQAWKRTNDNDLTRRLEAQLHPRQGAEGVRAIHRQLMADKQVAWRRAVAAASRSDEAERQANALEARAARMRDGAFFLQGLPPAARAATTGPDGAFGLSLAPGRYAVIATGERRQGVVSEVYVWLVWARLEAGQVNRVALTSDNLHGTDCAECAVAVGRLAE